MITAISSLDVMYLNTEHYHLLAKQFSEFWFSFSEALYASIKAILVVLEHNLWDCAVCL